MPFPELLRRRTAWAVLALVPLLAHAPLTALGLSADPLLFVAMLSHEFPNGVLPGLPGWNDPNAGFTREALGRRARGRAARRHVVPAQRQLRVVRPRADLQFSPKAPSMNKGTAMFP